MELTHGALTSQQETTSHSCNAAVRLPSPNAKWRTLYLTNHDTVPTSTSPHVTATPPASGPSTDAGPGHIESQLTHHEPANPPFHHEGFSPALPPHTGPAHAA